MKAIMTEQTNVIFSAEGCHDLPATKFEYEDGTPAIETSWELSEEELQQVQESGKIYLYIQGNSIQPCMLTTESILNDTEGGKDEQSDCRNTGQA